jgi:hypothetical protein
VPSHILYKITVNVLMSAKQPYHPLNKDNFWQKTIFKESLNYQRRFSLSYQNVRAANLAHFFVPKNVLLPLIVPSYLLFRFKEIEDNLFQFCLFGLADFSKLHFCFVSVDLTWLSTLVNFPQTYLHYFVVCSPLRFSIKYEFMNSFVKCFFQLKF